MGVLEALGKTAADANLEMAEPSDVEALLRLAGVWERHEGPALVEWMIVILKQPIRKLRHFLTNGQRQKSKSEANLGWQSGAVDALC